MHYIVRTRNTNHMHEVLFHVVAVTQVPFHLHATHTTEKPWWTLTHFNTLFLCGSVSQLNYMCTVRWRWRAVCVVCYWPCALAMCMCANRIAVVAAAATAAHFRWINCSHALHTITHTHTYRQKHMIRFTCTMHVYTHSCSYGVAIFSLYFLHLYLYMYIYIIYDKIQSRLLKCSLCSQDGSESMLCIYVIITHICTQCIVIGAYVSWHSCMSGDNLGWHLCEKSNLETLLPYIRMNGTLHRHIWHFNIY